MYKKKVVDGVTHPEPEPMRVIAGVQGPYNAEDVETINGVDTVLAKVATTKERAPDPQATVNAGVLDILECMCDAMYAMTEDTTTWLPIQQEIMRLKKLVHG